MVRSFEEISKHNPVGFPYINDFALLVARKEPIKSVHLKKNLYEWDSYLSKKIWNLRQSYVNMAVNFQRGIAIGKEDFKNELKVIQLFNYEFYAETSFYYLISARDIVYQIINLAFGLGLNEHRLNVEKITDKLKANGHLELYEIVNNIYSGLKEANDIRNSLAHKFSKLNSDNRSSLSDDGRTYGAGRRHFIDYPKQVEILENSLDCLNTFLLSVRSVFSQTYNLESDN